MDIKHKQKVVKLVGAAEIAVAKLEESVNALEAQGKTPAKADKQLLKSIQRTLDLLKMNPFAGEPVSPKLWPKGYENFPNLFCIDLTRFWRLLYYVAGTEVMIVSVVFEICDHKHYDKIFGYKKK